VWPTSAVKSEEVGWCRIEPKTRLRGAIPGLLAVIKVDLFAKARDITTHDEISACMTERHHGFLEVDLREGTVHVLCKVDHVAWPRPCFCNPKIQGVVKRIRMIGTVLGRSSRRCGL
jgi:hypothetical protein